MPVVPVSYLEFTLEAVYLFIPYHYVANFLGVAFQPDCLRVEIEAISGRNYCYFTDVEEIEMRFSGVPNAVVRVNRVRDEQNQEGQNQQNMNEENVC